MFRVSIGIRVTCPSACQGAQNSEMPKSAPRVLSRVLSETGVLSLVGVSDIFLFFSARGGGSSRRQRVGNRFFIENPREGGGSPGGGGAEVSAANWGIFLGGWG